MEVRPGVWVYKGLRATAIRSFLAVNTGPGHSTRYFSTENQFCPGVAPGIDRQTNFWRGGGLVEYDWHDHPGSGEVCPGPVTAYLRRGVSRIELVGIDR